MAVYTWTGTPGFTYTLDDTLPTIKDTVRVRIGDVNGEPVAYLSDNEITAIANQQNNDLFNTCADCAEACAFRVLSLSQSVQQGSSRMGLKIENFKLVEASAQFMKMADMFRNKSTNASVPVYGALSGKIRTCSAVAGYCGGYCGGWQYGQPLPSWGAALNPSWCPYEGYC